MPNYKEKLCSICSNEFKPNSPKQKYCDGCKEEGRKIKDRIRDKKRNRIKNGYVEYERFCLSCGSKFNTYYSKKKYCGDDNCENVRVFRKNYNTHIARDKDKLKLKGKRYYDTNRTQILIDKANKYREINPTDKEYISGRTCKLEIDYVREYVENFGYKLLSETYVNNTEKLSLKCPNGHEWKTNFHSFKDGNNRCFHCYINNNYVSSIEQKVRDYFSTNYPTLNVVYNDRTLIYPKELDMYFPDKKVAIELCGLYWHSDTANNIEKSYHYDKMIQCYNNGIRLITVFEDEINNKFDLVMSRIKQALGIIDKKIYARKCSISVVDNKIANEFFDKNHIQSGTPCKMAFGLFFNKELVACCSVGSLTRKHANINKTLELKRFCSLIGVSVVGGAGKLFKKVLEFAEIDNYTNIKSYCDMRYANIFKPVYEILGFDLLTETKYTPHYFIKGNRFRNMTLRKTPEERLTGKTELELRLEQGYNRIWDCGHRTYLISI